MPWITSKEGYSVLVDDEDFDLYGHLVWRSKGGRGGRDGVLYRQVETQYAWSNQRKKGKKRKRKEVTLHRLIASAKPGQSVHHKNGLSDCRRKSLVVYDSHEEHVAAEHPEINKKGKTNASDVRESRQTGQVSYALPTWTSREPVGCR